MYNIYISVSIFAVYFSPFANILQMLSKKQELNLFGYNV